MKVALPLNLVLLKMQLLHFIKQIESAGYVPGEEIAIAIDPASSEFYDDKEKVYRFEGQKFDF